jgi:hypothetical protein
METQEQKKANDRRLEKPLNNSKSENFEFFMKIEGCEK